MQSSIEQKRPLASSWSTFRLNRLALRLSIFQVELINSGVCVCSLHTKCAVIWYFKLVSSSKHQHHYYSLLLLVGFVSFYEPHSRALLAHYQDQAGLGARLGLTDSKMLLIFVHEWTRLESRGLKSSVSLNWRARGRGDSFGFWFRFYFKKRGCFNSTQASRASGGLHGAVSDW